MSLALGNLNSEVCNLKDLVGNFDLQDQYHCMEDFSHQFELVFGSKADDCGDGENLLSACLNGCKRMPSCLDDLESKNYCNTELGGHFVAELVNC